jgi:hypothetical protein
MRTHLIFHFDSHSREKKKELLVTFSVGQDSAKIIFPEKDVMSDFLAQVKSLKAAAGIYLIQSNRVKYVANNTKNNRK